MSDETLRWVIGGMLAVITAGLGYFLIRIEQDVRELAESLVKLDRRLTKYAHKYRRRCKERGR